MQYEYKISTMTENCHTFYVVESKVLKGCVDQGDTPEEALKEFRENEKEWIKTAEEVGIEIIK